jgi:hypothetical protein
VRDLETFAKQAEQANIRLMVNEAGLDAAARRSDEALFHVPLLALCILVVAHGKTDALRVPDLSVWVSATLASHFSGIKDAGPRLKWSIPLRRRCADALVFLEIVGLVVVDQGHGRTVRVSGDGAAFLRKQRVRTDEVGVLVRGLDRSHHGVLQTGLELL